MRITDIMLQNSFLNYLTKAKSRVSKLQIEMATQSKINRISDSPLGSSRVIRLNSQIEGMNTYLKNIGNARSFVEYSVTALDGMQSEIQKILGTMTDMSNSVQDENLGAFADKIDLIIESIVNYSNTKYNNQYVFGGTSHSSQPFGISADGKTFNVLNADVSGTHKINIAQNIQQQINIPGKEIFQSVMNLNGNLNSDAAVGDSQDFSSSVYDADGNEYTLNMSFVKTGGNNYDLNYSVTDADLNEILNDTAGVQFDSATGKLSSVNGASYKDFSIQVAGTNLNFAIDFDSIKESSSETSLMGNMDQKANIVDTLIAISNRLKNGERPTEFQGQVIDDFEKYLLNKLSKIGNIGSILDDSEDMINNQILELERLRSQELDIDVAKTLLELETQQFTLDLTYKTSAAILPKSLLDYL